jgi:hypothetical protein
VNTVMNLRGSIECGEFLDYLELVICNFRMYVYMKYVHNIIIDTSLLFSCIL